MRHLCLANSLQHQQLSLSLSEHLHSESTSDFRWTQCNSLMAECNQLFHIHKTFARLRVLLFRQNTYWSTVPFNISSRHLSIYLRLLNVKPTHQSRTNHVRLVELNGLQLTDVVKARSIGTWQICHRHVNIFGDIMEEIAELPSENEDVGLALVIG